jgi:hypothetical protein
MSDLAKKNIYPHRLGSSGYAGHEKKWQATEEKFAAQGKPFNVHPLNKQTRNWVWARTSGQVTGEGEMLLDCPDIQNVTTSLQQIVQNEKTGEFVPRRQHDELTEALGTAEHSDRVRGQSCGTNWKVGFPQEAQSYKKRDAYKAKMRQEITDQVIQQVTQQFYSLAAQHPQAFPDLVPHGSQSTQIPSSVGSVENTTYPIDSITGPTPCSLVVPIGRAGKTKEVASGLAIPGRQFHNSPIPADYARVQVARVNGDQMSLELDIPTPEGIELLGDAVSQLIL